MVVKDVLLMFAKKLSMSLQNLIPEAWSNRDLLKEATYSDAVRAVIEDVDKGGVVSLYFENLEQLDRIIQRLSEGL